MISLMQQHLFSEITVKQIVLEAKLERKTFYNNFSSKDDVLDSVINSAIYEYVQVLTTSADGPLSVIFNFCDKNRELLQLLHKNNLLYLRNPDRPLHCHRLHLGRRNCQHKLHPVRGRKPLPVQNGVQGQL